MTNKTISDIVSFTNDKVAVEDYSTAPEKIIDGTHNQMVQKFYQSEDKQFLAGLWESDVCRFHVNFTEHEFVQIISGKLLIRDSKGNETLLQAGDSIVIPAGFIGQWHVLEYTKKLFVNYERKNNA